jgi:peptide/nickel transport system substrate-binding protein
MRRALAWLAVGIAAAGAGCYERGSSNKPAPVRDDAGAIAPAPIAPRTGAEPAGPADPAATVRVRLEADPAHLNPLLADALAIRVAMGDVYEGLLCRRDPAQPPQPCLASRVDVDGAQTTWTFSLRDDVTWHDGKPLTAADVVYTYQLLASEPRAPSVLVAEVDDLRAIERIDDHTVRMRFREFRVGRIEAFANVPVLPAHAFAGAKPSRLAQAAASRAPVGTGPMRFSEWNEGELIALERFDGYWGDASKARRVEYRIVPSRQQAVAALAAGNLDVITQMPVDEAQAAASEGGARLFAYDTPAYLAAVWNTRKPALVDAAVRRALGMLLDRRGLIDQVFKGYARPIAGPFPARGIEVPIAASFASERRRAKLLLHGAGDVTPKLTLLVPSESRTMLRIADIWAADAAPLAELTVEQAPFSEVLERARTGRFDAVLLSFTTGDEFDHFDRFHSSQIGKQNYGAISDKALDDALESIRTTPGRDARLAIERDIEARLAELAPYCFMVSDQRVGLARANVGGVRVTRDGLSAASLWVQK